MQSWVLLYPWGSRPPFLKMAQTCFKKKVYINLFKSRLYRFFCTKPVHDPQTLDGFTKSVFRKSESVFFFSNSPAPQLRPVYKKSFLFTKSQILSCPFWLVFPSIARGADHSSWFGLSNFSGSYFSAFNLLSDFWTLATDTGSARNKTEKVCMYM